MSHRNPVRATDRHAFDTVIDARSPAEFAIDHIPGALNCPVLDDDERSIVGTLYKQQGAFEARRVGGAMVAANLAKHLRGPLADRPAGQGVLVLADVFGATPCNVAQRLSDGAQVRLLAGANLPMLLRAVGYRHEPLESVAQKALAGGTQGIMPVAAAAPQNQTRRAPNDQERDHHQQ